MNEFLAMGGYAQFVWPSYAITILAFAVNIWLARRAHRMALETARRRASTSGEPA